MKQNTNKELSIQVSLNGLSFCILNKTSNTVEFLNTILFETKLTPIDVLNRLKTELSINTVFSDEFSAVNVIHQNELSTLVPKGLYDERQKVDYLKFNTKILKTDYITHDDIVVNDSVNVYIPYVNINNYIFDTFGEFVYKHSSTLLIETILGKYQSSEKFEIYINVNKTTLEVLVVNKVKLQLFNNFEYNSKEDFIYYVLFVFEQLKLDVETTNIRLSGAIDKNDELFDVLYTYVRHVDIIESNLSYNFSEAIKNQKRHHHFLILNSF